MRHVLVAAFAGALLAACGAPSEIAPQPQDAAAAPAARFPDVFQMAYRAEASMTTEAGANVPIVMLRDGKKLRLDLFTAEGPVTSVVDRETGESFMLRHVRGRPVLVPPPTDPAAPPLVALPDLWWEGDISAAMIPVGPCMHLGENGIEWERAHNGEPQHVCVTEDGIVLWSANNGQTIWQLTGLQRGTQDASRFTLPRGARFPPLEREDIADQNATAAYVPPQFSTTPEAPAPQP